MSTALIHSPSDAATLAPGRHRFGGRLVERPEGWLLTDALTTLALHPPPQAPAGSLIIVDGDWAAEPPRSELRRVELVEALGGRPSANGEACRFERPTPLAARAQALRVVRELFHEEGFLEVDTPLHVPCPGLDLHVEAIAAQSGYLITSPEHHMKRLLVAGHPRIYQLGHCFRADESGPLHEPEFTLLEWYRAFAGQAAVMADTERLVCEVTQALTGSPHLGLRGREIDLSRPFERWTVEQAFREHAGVEDVSELAARDEDRYFQLLVDAVEPALAAQDRPVFLCEYPISQASLARPVPGRPGYAERFELYVAGVELCNGFGELTDAREQRRRYEQALNERIARGHPQYPMDERFLSALAEGMPPAGGNALGFDRLLQLVLRANSVGDVQAFGAQRA